MNYISLRSNRIQAKRLVPLRQVSSVMARLRFAVIMRGSRASRASTRSWPHHPPRVATKKHYAYVMRAIRSAHRCDRNVRALQPRIETESDVRVRHSPSKQQALMLKYRRRTPPSGSGRATPRLHFCKAPLSRNGSWPPPDFGAAFFNECGHCSAAALLQETLGHSPVLRSKPAGGD